MAFLANGKILASGSSIGQITLWDVSDPGSIKPLGLELPGSLKSVSGLALLAGRKILAAGGNEGKILLWNVSDLTSVKPLGSPLTDELLRKVRALAFLTGTNVLSAGGETGVESSDPTGRILLWDVSDPVLATPMRPRLPGQSKQINIYSRDITSLAFFAGSKILASGDRGGGILLWDVSDPASAKPLGPTMRAHRSKNGRSPDVNCLAFHTTAGNTILASGGEDGSIFLWDVSDSTSMKPPVAELTGHVGGVNSLAFLTDSNILTSGGDEGKILLWDVSNPRSMKPPVAELTRHSSYVLRLVYMADSRILASAGRDGNIFLWDVSDPVTAKPLGPPLTGHSNEIWSLAFLEDSKILVSGDHAGKIILWDMNWSRLQERACRIANRNLTTKEWNQYMSNFYEADKYHKTCPD